MKGEERGDGRPSQKPGERWGGVVRGRKGDGRRGEEGRRGGGGGGGGETRQKGGGGGGGGG